ncbi:MAG TPA: hypothetical protein VFO38_02520 [Candidatus Saccharimonadales bacterium]|nr:hypothetical protein [Candidatus Saccharimonadales bacterium]
MTWERVVAQIMKVQSVDRALAERIFDQTLGYLLLCSRRPELGDGPWLLGPSPEVDKGVHVFYLYTPELFELFESINNGVFIHHVPNDKPGAERRAVRLQTVEAFRLLNMSFDSELWASLAHGCANEDGEGPPNCFDNSDG